MKVTIDITDEEAELILTNGHKSHRTALMLTTSILKEIRTKLGAPQDPLSADMQRESIAFGRES